MRLPGTLLESAGVLALTLAAAGPRLISLDRVPPGLHGDEAWMGLEALRILHEGPIGVWSPSALGQPAGPFYWTAVLFLFLEPGIASVRASMALLGVLTVPAVYLFGRALWGPRAAFLGTALLAAGFWHIAYSRVALPPVALPLVASLAFAVLFWALERDRPAAYLWAGALLGLGSYAYIPYPFLALGVAFYLLGWAVVQVRKGRSTREVALRLGALAAGGLAVAGPLLIYLLAHPGPYARYGHLTLIPFMEGSLASKGLHLAERALQVPSHLFLGRPVDYSDGLGAQPLLDPLTGLLFAVGLGLVLARWRDRRCLFLLVVLAFGLLPGVLSGENWGESRRIVGALPAVYLLAGLGLSEALAFARAGLGRLRPALPLLAGGLVLLVVVLNLGVYFRDFARAEATRWVYAEELAAACAMLGAREESLPVYFYAARWSYRYETCQFLAPGLRGEDRSREFGAFGLEKRAAGPVLYLLLPPYADLAPAIEALYPGGQRTEGWAPDGRLLFVSYRAP